MKSLTLLLIFNFLGFNYFSQIQDTCDYVSQINQLGGLDCAVVSTANVSADSYQWLNCDSSFNEITGQTTQDYTGVSSVNVALEMTYLGCVDTSYCQYVCTIGIEEIEHNNRKLLKIVDSRGKESKNEPNKLLIFIYSDGTKEKVFRIE